MQSFSKHGSGPGERRRDSFDQRYQDVDSQRLKNMLARMRIGHDFPP
jgi:hypothetical protein